MLCHRSLFPQILTWPEKLSRNFFKRKFFSLLVFFSLFLTLAQPLKAQSLTAELDPFQEALEGFLEYRLLRNFQFFITFSSGFSPKSSPVFSAHLEALTQALKKNLNTFPGNSIPYRDYVNNSSSPLFFSLDFSVFYQYVGLEFSYSRFSYLDYTLGIAQDPTLNISYYYTIHYYRYLVTGNSYRGTALLQIPFPKLSRSLFTVLLGAGYGYYDAAATLEFKSQTDSLPGFKADFSSTAHGPHGLLEFRFSYNLFTYGFGTLVSIARFEKFTNPQDATVLAEAGGTALYLELERYFFPYFRLGLTF